MKLLLFIINLLIQLYNHLTIKKFIKKYGQDTNLHKHNFECKTKSSELLLTYSDGDAICKHCSFMLSIGEIRSGNIFEPGCQLTCDEVLSRKQTGTFEYKGHNIINNHCDGCGQNYYCDTNGNLPHNLKSCAEICMDEALN